VSKFSKRVGAALVAVGVLGSVALLRSRHPVRQPTDALEGGDDDRASRWRGFTAAEPGPGGDPTTASAPGLPALPAGGAAAPALSPEIAQKNAATMERWRQAILDRNAAIVLDCDETFLALPAQFGPLLEVSAQSDADDRVRAFSTRVLGKLKNIGTARLLERLLSDGSPYVRQNAAWGLGELAGHPAGRPAAAEAVAELRRLQESDPAPDVRTAAAAALKRLQ
jgi:HEAT repeat protein